MEAPLLLQGWGVAPALFAVVVAAVFIYRAAVRVHESRYERKPSEIVTTVVENQSDNPASELSDLESTRAVSLSIRSTQSSRSNARSSGLVSVVVDKGSVSTGSGDSGVGTSVTARGTVSRLNSGADTIRVDSHSLRSDSLASLSSISEGDASEAEDARRQRAAMPPSHRSPRAIGRIDEHLSPADEEMNGRTSSGINREQLEEDMWIRQAMASSAEGSVDRSRPDAKRTLSLDPSMEYLSHRRAQKSRQSLLTQPQPLRPSPLPQPALLPQPLQPQRVSHKAAQAQHDPTQQHRNHHQKSKHALRQPKRALSVSAAFIGDMERGLTSTSFDLSENVAQGDTRQGLDGSDEVLGIMREKRISFDDARLEMTRMRMLKAGIDPATGLPMDSRFVSFSGHQR
eukprot:Opistho-2@73948